MESVVFLELQYHLIATGSAPDVRQTWMWMLAAPKLPILYKLNFLNSEDNVCEAPNLY